MDTLDSKMVVNMKETAVAKELNLYLSTCVVIAVGVRLLDNLSMILLTNARHYVASEGVREREGQGGGGGGTKRCVPFIWPGGLAYALLDMA